MIASLWQRNSAIEPPVGPDQGGKGSEWNFPDLLYREGYGLWL